MSRVFQLCYFPCQRVVHGNSINQRLSHPIHAYVGSVTQPRHVREYRCGAIYMNPTNQEQNYRSTWFSISGQHNATTSKKLVPRNNFRSLFIQSLFHTSTKTSNSNKQRNDAQQHTRIADSNMSGNEGRSLGKKLLILWSGALLSIGVVVWLNQKLYIEKSDEAERKKRLERVKDNPSSTTQFLLTIPCMRNSLMLAIISSLSSWVGTFLFTSNISMANKAMFAVPCIIFPSYMAYCLVVTGKDRKESNNIKTALQELQQNKLETVMEKKDLTEVKND